MKLDRAIEILISDNKDVLISSVADMRAAQRLGIEALKGIMALRRGRGKPLSELLPGETEE